MTGVSFLGSEAGAVVASNVLLKEKPKSSQDTLSKLLAALNALEVGNEKDNEKALANVAKYLGFLKYHLFGDGEHEVTKEEALERARELVATDLLYLLVKHLVLLDFEARKDAAQVYGMLVRLRDSDDRSPGAAYVLQHPYILSKLFHGQVLESSIFMEFFDKVEVANFEIASDAFATFKDLLTRHKPFVAQFLQDHYNELLGELLLDRSNVKVMVRFVSEPQYLMQLMRMIKDQSRSIQFEAFHVFKVFVANPNKPQPIIDILTGNKEKLLKYLEEFHTDKDDDEQFKEEKAVIIKEISMLGLQPAGAGPPSTPAQHPPPPAAAPAKDPPPAQDHPAPPPAQDPPPPPPAQDPPAPAQDQPPAQAPPGPVPRPQAPSWGRWLDRDTNPCLNFQRIGESKQRPLELCSYEGLMALPPIGKVYQQGYKLVSDRLPKVRQRLHRAAEYRHCRVLQSPQQCIGPSMFTQAVSLSSVKLLVLVRCPVVWGLPTNVPPIWGL
ncbi:hypothetical protein QJQ45_001964 [Haematococcus lacustris]|nr:hypothetical protein QJQ45_001964 [Haematococcus lacustris]